MDVTSLSESPITHPETAWIANAVPLLLTVDWVIARGRSVTNVLSDMLLSILLDRNPVTAPENDDEAALAAAHSAPSSASIRE